MSAREWILPVLLGGLAATGVLLWPEPPSGPSLDADACDALEPGTALPPECRTAAGLHLDNGVWRLVGWPFPEPPVAWRDADGTVHAGTQLVVAEYERPEPSCDPDALYLPPCLDLAWHTDRVGTVEVAYFGVIPCDLEPPCDWGVPYLSHVLNDTGPFFGRDGHNATVVTVYVFDGDGEMVASSDDAVRRNRFRFYGDFVGISDTPWYLGDGPVPEGMRTPEGYVDFARQHLVGLPVGAVATAYLPEHEYDWLTGPLWVTVRVDAVLDAP